MKHYDIAVDIRADAGTIWTLLTDGAGYADWNESVERIEGVIAPGRTIKVYAKISPDRAFPVKVSEFVPNRRMVWVGGMPLGLFKGVRTFTLEDQDSGAIRFRMHEVFSGPMAWLITRSMPDLAASFNEFAASLKRRAEAVAR